MSISSNHERMGHLSYKESLTLTLIPAVVFLVNGLLVLLLKSLEAPIGYYFSLPLLLVLIGIFAWRTLCKRESKNLVLGLKKYAFIFLVPLIFALSHFYIFGSSFGGDTASYFTNPVYTFSESGHFSHGENPFFEYGDQPLAVYWLPANSEFMFTGLGHLFGLEYRQTLALMHISSNYLMSFAVLLVALRFFKPIEALIFCLCFWALLYGLLNHRRDFTASSFFRGFDNKGLIWGYFFWATVNLLGPVPSSDKDLASFKAGWLFIAGIILGTAGFLVSGNAINLLFLVLALIIGAMVSGQFRSLYAFAGLSCSLLGTAAIFKFLEAKSIYSAATLNPRLEQLTHFETHQPFFQYPLWIWVFCGLTLVGLWFKNRKTCIYLAAFFIVAALLRSEIYFNFFTSASPEFAIIFWRHVTLVNPLLILFCGGCILIGSLGGLSNNRGVQFAGLAILTSACCLGFLIGALRFPPQTPFETAENRPVMKALANLCPAGSKVLATNRYSTHLPTLQPAYVYLVGKEPFINWQIGNLPPSSEMHAKASAARSAALYMIRDHATGEYPADTKGMENLIRLEPPDVIIVTRNRVSDDNKHIFKGYKMQRYKNMIAFTKPSCSSDFSKRVKQEIEKERPE